MRWLQLSVCPTVDRDHPDHLVRVVSDRRSAVTFQLHRLCKKLRKKNPGAVLGQRGEQECGKAGPLAADTAFSLPSLALGAVKEAEGAVAAR